MTESAYCFEQAITYYSAKSMFYWINSGLKYIWYCYFILLFIRIPARKPVSNFVFAHRISINNEIMLIFFFFWGPTVPGIIFSELVDSLKARILKVCILDASGLPGKPLEIQTLRPHFKGIEWEILGMGPSDLHFDKPFRCFWCTFTFEN